MLLPPLQEYSPDEQKELEAKAGPNLLDSTQQMPFPFYQDAGLSFSVAVSMEFKQPPFGLKLLWRCACVCVC